MGSTTGWRWRTNQLIELDESGSGLLRPCAIVVGGALEFGLEVLLSGGVVQEIRPHTGMPDPYVLSPAFVNAHSHLEYRGFQGALKSTEYMPWILELVRGKFGQQPDEVRADCLRAAHENVAAGIAAIAEHSDRIGAAEAMATEGLAGHIFQEVVTFSDPEPAARVEEIGKKLAEQAAFWPTIRLSPHAPHTVDEVTLRQWATPTQMFSIHVNETNAENEFFLNGTGPIAEMFASLNVAARPRGVTTIEFLDSLGLVNSFAQFVHGCAITADEIPLLAERGVRVAHCPRSNRALNCPTARVRQMLEANVRVGLGLDSPASSGPIDMFAEMQAALDCSRAIGEPLSGEQVWDMATTGGAASIDMEGWSIAVGNSPPLIALAHNGENTIEELILAAPQPTWIGVANAQTVS